MNKGLMSKGLMSRRIMSRRTMSTLSPAKRLSAVALLMVACMPSLAVAQDGEYGFEVRRHDTVILQGRREIDGQVLEANDACARRGENGTQSDT